MDLINIFSIKKSIQQFLQFESISIFIIYESRSQGMPDERKTKQIFINIIIWQSNILIFI